MSLHTHSSNSAREVSLHHDPPGTTPSAAHILALGSTVIGSAHAASHCPQSQSDGDCSPTHPPEKAPAVSRSEAAWRPGGGRGRGTRWSLEVRMSASGNCAMYGTGLRTLSARARARRQRGLKPGRSAVPAQARRLRQWHAGQRRSSSAATAQLMLLGRSAACSGVLLLATAGSAMQRRARRTAHQTASTSVMRMSNPMTVNSSISAIFSRPCGAARRASVQGPDAPLSDVLGQRSAPAGTNAIAA